MENHDQHYQYWRRRSPVIHVYGIMCKPKPSNNCAQQKILLNQFVDMVKPKKSKHSGTPVEEFPSRRLKLKYCNITTTHWRNLPVMDPNAIDLRITRYSCNIDIFKSPALNLATLGLHHCKLSVSVLTRLLKITPNLKSFKCVECIIMGPINVLYSTSYLPARHQQLNMEVMKFTGLSSKAFFSIPWSKILGALPNLKRLHINNLETRWGFNHIMRVIENIKRKSRNREALSLTKLEPPLILRRLMRVDMFTLNRLQFPLKTLDLNAEKYRNCQPTITWLVEMHSDTLKKLRVVTRTTIPIRFPIDAIPSTITRLELLGFSFANLDYLRHLPDLVHLDIHCFQQYWQPPFENPPFILRKLKTFIYESANPCVEEEIEAFSYTMPAITTLDIQLDHFDVFKMLCTSTNWKYSVRKLDVCLPAIESDKEFAAHIIQLRNLEDLQIITLMKTHGFGYDAVRAFRKLKFLSRLGCSLDILALDLDTLADLLRHIDVDGKMPTKKWGKVTIKQYIKWFLAEQLKNRGIHVGNMAPGNI